MSSDVRFLNLLVKAHSFSGRLTTPLRGSFPRGLALNGTGLMSIIIGVYSGSGFRMARLHYSENGASWVDLSRLIASAQ